MLADRCNHIVFDSDNGRSMQLGRQCKLKPWRDGFCKRHHPDEIKRRERERLAIMAAVKELDIWK